MIRNSSLFFAFTSFVVAITLHADPAPTQGRGASGTTAKKEASAVSTRSTKITSAGTGGADASSASLPYGWSLINGTWMHSDGYKYVNGKMISVGPQRHKQPPKPPTKADLEAAKSKATVRSDADAAAAARAAERARNMKPTYAPQTGSHL